MLKKFLSSVMAAAVIAVSCVPAISVSAEEEQTRSYIYNNQMTVLDFIKAKRDMLSNENYTIEDYKLIREFLLKRYKGGKFYSKLVAVSFDIEEMSTDLYSDPSILDTKLVYVGSTMKIPQHTLQRENSSHGGWVYNGKNYKQGETFEVPDDNIVFTPYWYNYHIVTYYAGDYDDIVGQNTVTVQGTEGIGLDLAGSSRFSRKGYSLVGWKCSADNKIYGTSGRYTMPDADVTFTAVWNPSTVNISISANNGISADRISDSAVTGEEYTLPECNFTNGDKTFAGWKYSGTVYNAGDKIIIPALLSGQKVVITAVWS